MGPQNVRSCPGDSLGLTLPGHLQGWAQVGPEDEPESTTGVFWKAPIRSGH